MRNEDVKLEAFPQTHFEALAMLYVEKHSTIDTTPEKMIEMYREALNALRNYNKSHPSYL